jgi:hypothetical protein
MAYPSLLEIGRFVLLNESIEVPNINILLSSKPDHGDLASPEEPSKRPDGQTKVSGSLNGRVETAFSRLGQCITNAVSVL